MVLRLGIGEPRNGPLGNNQDMDRRLGFDIAKSQHQVVLVNDVRRNLPSNNFFEKRLTHIVPLEGCCASVHCASSGQEITSAQLARLLSALKQVRRYSTI